MFSLVFVISDCGFKHIFFFPPTRIMAANITPTAWKNVEGLIILGAILTCKEGATLALFTTFGKENTSVSEGHQRYY